MVKLALNYPIKLKNKSFIKLLTMIDIENLHQDMHQYPQNLTIRLTSNYIEGLQSTVPRVCN